MSLLSFLHSCGCYEKLQVLVEELFWFVSLFFSGTIDWNGHLYYDAAIIYPLSRYPYVLVVITRGLSDEKDALLLVSSISRIIYGRQSEWL